MNNTSTPPTKEPDEQTVFSLSDEWDTLLQALWDPNLSVALAAAESLFLPEAGERVERARRVKAEHLATHFWNMTIRLRPVMPETPTGRYATVAWGIGRILHALQSIPGNTAMEGAEIAAYVETSLCPVHRLHLGLLTSDVCDLLYEARWGRWAFTLTKVQTYRVQQALARTLASLPPEEMGAYWERLTSEDRNMRQAMRQGLEYLRSEHALPHLLRGLEILSDHEIRSAIVDCLEQIGDARAIPLMTRLQRETAFTDWTLSRHIARVLRVIEVRNRTNPHRFLLRPSSIQNDPNSLLRPAADTEAVVRRNEAEAAQTLVRPAEPPETE